MILFNPLSAMTDIFDTTPWSLQIAVAPSIVKIMKKFDIFSCESLKFSRKWYTKLCILIHSWEIALLSQIDKNRYLKGQKRLWNLRVNSDIPLLIIFWSKIRFAVNISKAHKESLQLLQFFRINVNTNSIYVV